MHRSIQTSTFGGNVTYLALPFSLSVSSPIGGIQGPNMSPYPPSHLSTGSPAFPDKPLPPILYTCGLTAQLTYLLVNETSSWSASIR